MRCKEKTETEVILQKVAANVEEKGHSNKSPKRDLGEYTFCSILKLKKQYLF